jgi:hypothetical protein
MTFVRPKSKDRRSRLERTPRKLPVPVVQSWAEQIDGVRDGDLVRIVGKDRNSGQRNLLDKYKRYIWSGTLDQQSKGLHIEFANQSSDDLVDFVVRNGPILNSGCRVEHARYATENLVQLKAAHRVFRGAVELVGLVLREEFPRENCLQAQHELLDAVLASSESLVPNPFRAALVGFELIQLKTRSLEGPLTNDNVREICQETLCELFNQFPEVLICTDRGVVSGPRDEEGLFSVMMFMLRNDFISERQINQCGRCGQYFLQRRYGERACSEYCGELLRSSRYYARHRKKVLARRRKKRIEARRTRRGGE